MSDPHVSPESNKSPFTRPAGIVLLGEGMARMTPERLEMLAEMVGGLGLRIAGAGDVETLAPPPIPASKDDFIQFAEESGQAKRLAINAWNVIERTATYDKLPEVALRFAILEEKRCVDLRSVRARFMLSGFAQQDVWTSRADAPVSFLRALVESHIGFDTSDSTSGDLAM